MEEIFQKIWDKLIFETDLGPKLKANGISILYKITNPDMVMYIDEKGAIFGREAETKTPVIIESMSGETIHKFLLKKIDMPTALAQNKIKARGSATKMLTSLSLMNYVQDVYPVYCREYGLPID